MVAAPRLYARRARNQQLQAALTAAHESSTSLTQQLQEAEKRHASQVAEIVRQRDEVRHRLLRLLLYSCVCPSSCSSSCNAAVAAHARAAAYGGVCGTCVEKDVC